jgi:hypothetical protein
MDKIDFPKFPRITVTVPPPARKTLNMGVAEVWHIECVAISMREILKQEERAGECGCRKATHKFLMDSL